MMWLLPVGMSLLGGMQAEKKRKADMIDNELQAEITRYSPWTGKEGNIHAVSGGFFDGAMKGALSGLGVAQQFGDMGGSGKTDSNFDTSSYTLDHSERMELPSLGSDYSPKDSGYLGAKVDSPYSFSSQEISPYQMSGLSDNELLQLYQHFGRK